MSSGTVLHHHTGHRRRQRERYRTTGLEGFAAHEVLEVLAKVLIARGSISDVPSYPRIVADYALRYNAHAVIICHNHPGGSLVPSAADIGATIRMQAVLEELEVRLIDSLVVAEGQAVSAMENGLFLQIDQSIIEQNRAANSAGEVTIAYLMAAAAGHTQQETDE